MVKIKSQQSLILAKIFKRDMMESKKLLININNFKDMINKNYLYVDKTKSIYDIFIADNSYHFLSRLRGFGKSLLTSTLKESFSGNKESFKG